MDQPARRREREEIGLSQVQVSRLRARIIARLRVLVTPTDEDLNQSA